MASNCPSIWDDESELDVASVGGARKKSSAFDKGNDFVHNEVLCYLINKIDIISHDLLVKIASDFYSDDEIEVAKKVLYETCITDARKKIRKGQNKKKTNVADMIALIHGLDFENIPKYCAIDLSRIPPVDVNSIDVTGITQEIHQFNAARDDVGNLVQEMDQLQKQMSDLITEVKAIKRPSYAQAIANDVPQHRQEKVIGSTRSNPQKQNCPSTVMIDQRQQEVRESQPAINNAKTHNDRGPDNGLSGPANGSDSEDEFQEVRSVKHGGRRSRKTNFVVGTSASPNGHRLNIHKRHISLFVTRLDPDTDPGEVKDYVKSKFKADLNCTKLKTRYDSYSSFKIEGFCENIDEFFKADNWPCNVLIRKFYKPKD